MSSSVQESPVQPVSGSDKVGSEFAELVSGCGIFDLGNRAKIALTGGDRVRWLNGMVTNNVRDLAVGHGVYAFLLNPQGHILGDLYAYNSGESLVVDTERSQREKILATFDHYIIMDDVEVTDNSDKVTAIGVAGPKSVEVLKAAGFGLLPQTPLEFGDQEWHSKRITLVRGDNPAVVSYEIWAAPDDAAVIADALLVASAKRVSAEALELMRIAAGIPRYRQDIRERDLPQETEQTRTLNFNKGCYIGQEIVERIRSRGAVHRTFTGFVVEGELPAAETRIQSESKDIGEVTSAASLPLADGDFKVCLGYVRREFAAPGKSLQAGGAVLTVSSLPFEKVFPRHN